MSDLPAVVGRREAGRQRHRIGSKADRGRVAELPRKGGSVVGAVFAHQHREASQDEEELLEGLARECGMPFFEDFESSFFLSRGSWFLCCRCGCGEAFTGPQVIELR